MTDLYPILSRLGLGQYLAKFREEGFETWETVLDITESDLEALGVKLGHRRVLQKEIAHVRGVSVEQLHSASTRRRTLESDAEGKEDKQTDAKSNTGAGGKRKYRRHPKADEYAPDRPPSAYVIFSSMREILKPDGLSFTAIAKAVGERWQELPVDEKEPYESEATLAKEKYHAEMSEYKTTKAFREYQHYLNDFKAKNVSNSDGKRPKLTKVESTTSTSSTSSQQADSSASVISQSITSPSLSHTSEMGHARIDSMGSRGYHPTTSGFSSPAMPSYGSASTHGGISSIIPLGNASPIPISPSIPSFARESSSSLFSQGGHIRPSIETHSERITSGHGYQTMPRFMPPENRIEVPRQQTTKGSVSGSNIDPRLSHGTTSPTGRSTRSSRIPSLAHHETDTSSNPSTASNPSGPSTAASSLQYSPGLLDSKSKVAMSLPPLSTVGLHCSSGPMYADPTARPTYETLASRTTSSHASSTRTQSPSRSSSSTGMKFESLQLPLPHNISFGQRPLPRATPEEKLANIFDLQDIPRERNSLRNMTLEQEQGSVTPTSGQGLPKARHPPRPAALPNLPSMSPRHHDSHESGLHPNADPLSVLAYAGRIVGREYRPSP